MPLTPLLVVAVAIGFRHGLKMFDLAWYLEWEEGEGAPTWGKMWVFINNPRLCSLFTV